MAVLKEMNDLGKLQKQIVQSSGPNFNKL